MTTSLRSYPGPGSGDSITALKHFTPPVVVTAITPLYSIVANTDPAQPVWDGTVVPNHIYFLFYVQAPSFSSGSVTIESATALSAFIHFCVAYGDGVMAVTGPLEITGFLLGLDVTIDRDASIVTIESNDASAAATSSSMGVANLGVNEMVVGIGHADGTPVGTPGSWGDESVDGGGGITLLFGQVFGIAAAPFGWTGGSSIKTAGFWRILATDGR